LQALIPSLLTVAAQTARQALRFVKADVPICEHLADQLVVPLALAGGGRFLAQKPGTAHLQTALAVAALFTGLRGRMTSLSKKQILVEIGS
jgi:RNA 3'-terminal phosphate cyclase (ATP)